MTKQFTVVKKGNMCLDQMANVATEYTKWRVTVKLDTSFRVPYADIVSVEFITGLDASDLTEALKERSNELESIIGQY